jgi:hypothetical protein
MEFKKYQHIERFGTDEVLGIEDGENYVFPKIDGTNSSVWLDNGVVKAGSRKRELSIDKDNAGFYSWVILQSNIRDYLIKHPTHRLYGEWLVPHSLKTYRKDTWRNLYIFDVCEDDGEYNKHLHYETYKPLLEEFNIDYIPPIAILKGGTYEKFIKLLEKNGYLIEDGKGLGEGIVIKNYDYYNKYSRQTWAKIVTNEFKERHAKEMGVPTMESTKLVEEKIAEDYCTVDFIEKEYAKIRTEKDGWSSKYIPELLGRAYSTLIKEEMWNIIKANKYPTINFKTLNFLVIKKIKEIKSELF